MVNYYGDYTYGDAPKGKFPVEATPVGSFDVANAFGLYDMHGNVWEWCADHWHENYEGAPSDGSAWLSDNDNQGRILRGGSWGDDPSYCRSVSRVSFSPLPLRQAQGKPFALCPFFFSLSPPSADRYFFEKWTNNNLDPRLLG